MKGKIVVFGSYVADLTGKAPHLPKAGETVFGEYFQIGPGGKGSNQATAAHRAGGDVTFITKMGKDLFGQQALKFFEANGMDAGHIITDEKESTGIALICVDEGTGQNQILVVPAACTSFNRGDMERVKPAIAGADILLVQLEINLDALAEGMRTAKEAGAKVILNPAPARVLPEEILRMTDVITPNETEAETLTGIKVTGEESAKKAADVFHQKGMESVIITMGKQGVFVSDGREARMIPARKVEVVDTTGAGDAFNGGLATALSEGKDLFTAAEFGNALASLSVQAFGTAPSMPYREAIDQVL